MITMCQIPGVYKIIILYKSISNGFFRFIIIRFYKDVKHKKYFRDEITTTKNKEIKKNI